MNSFQLLASPWWVNLVALAPFIAYFVWRKGLRIAHVQLLWAALFAIAFGVVEASVVVYLRAATGLLPGFQSTLAEVRNQSLDLARQLELLQGFPPSLLTVELIREAATIAVLAAVGVLGTRGHRERWALFFWCFALWDITYYIGLRAFIAWPQSLTAPDILFLIPRPWLSQVWFPLLISLLMLAAVLLRTLQYTGAEVSPEYEDAAQTNRRTHVPAQGA